MDAERNGFRLETVNGTARLEWEGELTYDRAAELKEALLKALSSSGRVELDLTHVSRTDTSILQILCAAHREAVALEKRLCWAGTLSSEVGNAMQAAGFPRHAGCANGCLWRVEEKQ